VMNPYKSRLRLLLMLLLALASCERVPDVLEPLSQPNSIHAAPPRISGAIPKDRSAQQVFEAPGPTPAPVAAAATPANAAGQGGDVSLNFVDTDIREVARSILGATLKLNYTIDPNVHGTATLDTGRPLPRSALLPTLETLLNQNGATLIEKNGIYAVVPVAVAGATNAAADAEALGGGSQVIALRYTSAKDLAKTLEPFVADGGKITADTNRNVVIVSGNSAVRQTLLSLIRSFDVDTLAGQSFALFPAGDGDLAKTAAALEKAMRAEADGPLGGIVRVIPLERVNAVLVASSQPRYLDAAKRFFSLTNRAADATVRSWHVYYVKNGQSTDLANLLQQAFTPGNVTPAGPGSTAPGATPVSMGAGAGSGSLFQKGSFGSTSNTTGTNQTGSGVAGLPAAGTNQQANATGNAPPLPVAEPLSSQMGEAEAADRVRIIPNNRNNALLIYSTPSEYSMIHGMLVKVDIIPLQVLIEATIAEVTLNDVLQYGTQFFLKSGKFAATLGSTPTLPTTFSGFALSRAPDFILQALADVTQVRVLSAPRLLVMDNEPAHLQVGQEVPILTGTATSTLTTGAPIVNSIDYHSTGVILQVTPRVNSDGLITLDLAQEVSDVAPPAANTATGSPTFDDRIVRTRLAVQDGQTIGVAGLIKDTVSEENSGIPFLKDVPVLSALMSTQNNSRMRTELLVMITPHVVNDQRSARALTEDMRTQLINAGLVPQTLERKPPSGSHNPNGL
ncbi:MAG TPA: secretin N-terminal domain-containing protein, partial [Stellaceae bacterium]|nr:secretin N-terminal domain-containing protein [Stellaceae bacterium]